MEHERNTWKITNESSKETDPLEVSWYASWRRALPSPDTFVITPGEIRLVASGAFGLWPRAWPELASTDQLPKWIAENKFEAAVLDHRIQLAEVAASSFVSNLVAGGSETVLRFAEALALILDGDIGQEAR